MAKHIRIHLTEPVHLTEGQCPYCGEPIDAATGATGERLPTPGAFSVCFGCGGLLVFTDDLNVREPDPGELEVMLKHEQLMVIQKAVRSLKR